MNLDVDNWSLGIKKYCSVCCGSNLVQILDLPALPLTGIYLSGENTKQPTFDQAFDLCSDCGHGQLRYVIDPALVYDQTYAHRSSNSPIALSGNDFFFDFIREVTGKHRFRRILEVGCNDLYLLNKLSSIGEEIIGVDPIWKDVDPPTDSCSEVHVIGGFVEDLDATRDIGGRVDMIVSAHTFEHLDDPRAALEKVVSFANSGALIFLEVPSLDTLLHLGRFDQVFHQHINYFGLASLLRLIQFVGSGYVAHRFNHGYWGGTLMVAFKKGEGNVPASVRRPTPEIAQRQAKIFHKQTGALVGYMDGMKDERLFGFGAAQMLPILAYHMQSDLSVLEAILDDDPERQGRRLAGLKPEIVNPDNIKGLEECTILVTAIDSARPILKRLIELNPRHIIVPNLIH